VHFVSSLIVFETQQDQAHVRFISSCLTSRRGEDPILIIVLDFEGGADVRLRPALDLTSVVKAEMPETKVDSVRRWCKSLQDRKDETSAKVEKRAKIPVRKREDSKMMVALPHNMKRQKAMKAIEEMTRVNVTKRQKHTNAKSGMKEKMRKRVKNMVTIGYLSLTLPYRCVTGPIKLATTFPRLPFR